LQLCHPHVIRLLDVFLIPTHLALVLEYAEMGDLHTYVMSRRGLSEGESRWFFQQIILAIDFCNKMGVANRDVKLENMLLTSGGPPGASPLVKLGDFGFSKDMIHQSAATTRVGTVMYMAPEVLTAPPGGVYDASKADVWSCGVVLYAMLTGVYPFKRVPEDLKLSPAQAVRAALQRILAGDYSIPERISPEAADMIQSLLEQGTCLSECIPPPMQCGCDLHGTACTHVAETVFANG
jgi:serine/threonine-protein kinase SRK2